VTARTLAEEAWEQAFGDLPVEAGLALREGTGWRHWPAADPARHRRLLSIADLDAFLATDAARAPRLSMADGSRRGSAAVPQEVYLREDGRADLPRLLAAFDGGATLVVSQFHEMHAPLTALLPGAGAGSSCMRCRRTSTSPGPARRASACITTRMT
jgi:hypothetical protein